MAEQDLFDREVILAYPSANDSRVSIVELRCGHSTAFVTPGIKPGQVYFCAQCFGAAMDLIKSGHPDQDGYQENPRSAPGAPSTKLVDMSNPLKVTLNVELTVIREGGRYRFELRQDGELIYNALDGESMKGSTAQMLLGNYLLNAAMRREGAAVTPALDKPPLDRLSRLPKPTNKQSKRMLQNLCNSLALAPTRECKYLHSCVLCGTDITSGEMYKDRGYARRAHLDCFVTMGTLLNWEPLLK